MLNRLIYAQETTYKGYIKIDAGISRNWRLISGTFWDSESPTNHPLKDCCQTLLLILSKLSELNNFYFPWNHQKAYNFLIVSGGIELTIKQV